MLLLESRSRRFKSCRLDHLIVAQLGSALALGARGREFKSLQSDVMKDKIRVIDEVKLYSVSVVKDPLPGLEFKIEKEHEEEVATDCFGKDHRCCQ